MTFCSVEGSDTFLKDGKLSVLLSSFKSKVIRVQVSKKEDKKKVELLSDDDSENGVWNHIAKYNFLPLFAYLR